MESKLECPRCKSQYIIKSGVGKYYGTVKKMYYCHDCEYRGREESFQPGYIIKESIPKLKQGHEKTFSPETLQKMSAAKIGVPHTEEHKKKNSEAKMGERNPNYGTRWTEERKQKMLASRAWYKHTPETLEKISNTRTGQCCGENNHNFGKPIPDWLKEIFRERKLGLYDGPDHPQWKGGISKLPYPFAFDDYCKDEARKEFDYKCGLCGVTIEEYKKVNTKNKSMALAVHHIDYDKDNLHPSNLIPLCPKHHSKSNHSREYWKLVFERIMYFKLKGNEGEGSNLIPS